MIVGSVCLSHSPLRDRNRIAPTVENQFEAALAEVRGFIERTEPDITIVFYPDHLNGVFYNLLPPFCIGLEGTSIGDYGSTAGALDIPTDRAAALARWVLDAGVDAAISHDLHVDHGCVQPLEWLSGAHSLFRVIPIFVNSAAPPLPTFERVRALGRAVGEWARQAPERILIIGSGGLSHDPPLPALASVTNEVRQRIVKGTPLNFAQRAMRHSRSHLEGAAMASGSSSLLPADSRWDRLVLDGLLAGDLTVLDRFSDEDIARTGGRGGHEVRTWIAALAALGEGYEAQELFHAVIDEWITGMGIVRATPASPAH